MVSIEIAAPAGISSRGSSRGANVRRAGPFTAETRNCDRDQAVEQPDAVARPANACAANSAEIAARLLLVASTSRRRSTASMIGPPTSPPTIEAAPAASPTPPTAADDPVSV